ncbi:MAG: hypothetical protein FWG05_02550, partial [Kiritimatiellaeota bacterium]|nr:hypothetical protein [Kiritimatiellota bacterium]
MRKLVVIDVMPLLYRGHFAFLSRPMTNSKGVNISALFVFAATVRDMISQEGVTHCALAMDSSPTFRHRLYPEYKAKRDKMPEDISASIPMAEEFANAMRVPFLKTDDFEADDIMGTLAAMAESAGFETVLVSPDKDIAQLVTARTTLLRPAPKSGAPNEIYDIAKVRDEWGISDPAQMTDYLAIAGDASDNIPGIPGIGPKTAAQLLSKYGDLATILKEAPNDKIRAGADSARLSRELTAIRRDAPVGITLDNLSWQGPDLATAREFCEKYELFSLMEKICGGGRVVRQALHGNAATTPHSYHLIRTETEMTALAERLAKSERFAFDTESTGLDVRNDQLVGISFSMEAGEAFYVPVEVELRNCEMPELQNCEMPEQLGLFDF